MITCYDKSHKYRKAYNFACSFTISMKNKWMDNSPKSTSLIIAWKLSWLMIDAYVHTYIVDIRVHVNDLYSMLSRQEDLMKWITWCMPWQTKYKFHSGRSRVGFLTRCRRHVSIDLFVRIKSRKVQAISSKKEKKEYKLTTASHGTWDFFCLIFNGSDQDLLKKISHEVYHYAFCCASGYYWNQESVRNLMILRLNPTQPY
jgi:hypothetical protein